MVKMNPAILLGQPGNWKATEYASNDPLDFVDTSGHAIIYTGLGASYGSDLTSGQTYNSYTGTAFIGTTNIKDGPISGNSLNIGNGHIAGPLSIGIGTVIGFDTRNVENLKDYSKSKGFSIGPLSFSKTEDASGKTVGFEIGLFKSMGIGYFEMENDTKVKLGKNPTKISNDIHKNYTPSTKGGD